MNAGNPNKPPGEDVESDSTPPYDDDMNRRVTRLEVVLETVLPTLATKADVAALRAEMQAGDAALRLEMNAGFASMQSEIKAEAAKQTQSMHKWMIATGLVLLFNLGGLMLTLFNVLRVQ